MKNRLIQYALTGMLSFLISSSIVIHAQAPTISYQSVLTGLNDPVEVVNAGDGSNRLFIVEQSGTIKIWNGVTTSIFANFGATGANIISFGGEQGLLSMAFHPQYDGVNNRFFFIYYNDVSGDIAVRRYETAIGNPNTVNLSTSTPIITIPHPGASNHNGGKLNFGPDGHLYFATGDGGGGNDPSNNAQNGNVLLGKMLRLNIDTTTVAYGNYGIPTTPTPNPYVSDPTIDDRIWALGLRNPFRWSFDRLTGDMWIGDVGQGAQEEINFRPAGSTGNVNYGWRCYEGYPSTPGVPDCTPVNYVPPVYDYPNPAGSSTSVIGGYVYRGNEYPNFRGYYMALDVYSGDVFLLSPNGGSGFDSSVQTGLPVNFMVGFGEAEDETLYVVSQGTNAMYKVVATGGTALPVKFNRFNVQQVLGFNRLQWKTYSEINSKNFHIEYGYDGRSFQRAGLVSATGSSNGSTYQYDHVISTDRDLYYRIAVEDIGGAIQYSDVIRIGAGRNNKIRIYPTVISDGLLQIQTANEWVGAIQIISTSGAVVYSKTYSSFTGNLLVSLPPLAKGIYIVCIKTSKGNVYERVLVE